MVDVARLALQIDVNGAQRARQALKGLQDGSVKVTQTTEKLAGVYSRLDKIIELSAKSQGQYNSALASVSSAIKAQNAALTSLASEMASAKSASDNLSETTTKQATLFDQLRSGTVQLTQVTGAYSSAYERLRASVDPAYRASLDYRRATQVLDAELKRGTITLTEYNRTLRLIQSSSQQVVRGGIMPMRGAIQQAGFQIGDFATQVASGQSAMVAFTQQGTQLLGVFGPGGAVAGALLAIGGAIAGSFVSGMNDGADATVGLIDRTKELVEQLGEATRRQREFINTDFQQQVQEQERAIQAANEAIFDANTRLERFRRLNQDVPEAVFNSNGAVQELRQTVEDARLSLDNANSSIKATRLAQEEFWKEVEKASEVEREQANELEKLVSGYTTQAAVIGLSARETALYEAARLNATAADRAAINAAFDAIEAEERRQQALKDSVEAQRDFNRDLSQLDPAGAEFNRYADQLDRIEQYNISAREKERLREEAFRQHQDRMIAIAKQGNDGVAMVNAQGLQLFTDSQTAALGVLGQVFGNMASIAEKGGKKQFDTWKTLASAQAAVSTALAVSNALATPPAPLGIALATTVGALGAVQIAQIQATEYQGSFLGGGFTGTGPRTGGLDGKGGFPAILHPNETVIDHTMGQGMGDINVVINNAPAGTSAEVSRGRDGTITIDMFQADMANGGPMSRSMQSTFGMRRQGR